MGINPSGVGMSHAWNYSNADREGYSSEIVGTVEAFQEVQATVYNTNRNAPRIPAFWDDGKPKMNIRMWFCTAEGEHKFLTFTPASKAAREGTKKSIHLDLFALTGNTDMKNLIGKTIQISTVPGNYAAGNPRPWNVQLVDAGPFTSQVPLPDEAKVERVLMNAAVSGGQMNSPQMPQPQYPQGYGMAPQMQMPQQMYQQPMQQPMQPMYQQPMQQQQYPQGMNQNVAQAMQNLGVPSAAVYDDMPF